MGNLVLTAVLSLYSLGLYVKEVSYVLECSVWYFQLHGITGSPSEKDYELGTAWLFSVSICQRGEPGSYTPGLWDIRQNKRKKEGKYSPVIRGEEGGRRNPMHFPVHTKSNCQQSSCELLGVNPTRTCCN